MSAGGDLDAKAASQQRSVAEGRRRSHDIGLELQRAVRADAEHVTIFAGAAGNTFPGNRDKIDLTRNEDHRVTAATAADRADDLGSANGNRGAAGKHLHVLWCPFGDLSRDKAEGPLPDDHPDAAIAACRIIDEFIENQIGPLANREGGAVAKQDLRPDPVAGDDFVAEEQLAADGQPFGGRALIPHRPNRNRPARGGQNTGYRPVFTTCPCRHGHHDPAGQQAGKDQKARGQPASHLEHRLDADGGFRAFTAVVRNIRLGAVRGHPQIGDEIKIADGAAARIAQFHRP